MQWFALATLLALTGACSRETPEAKRDRFLESGKKQVALRDYAAAAIQFKNAAQAKPKDAEPYYQLGLTSLSQGDVRSGMLYLRKAHELDPLHVGAQLKIAELEARTTDKDLLNDAESRVKGILAQSPANAVALDMLAVTEYELGKQVDAEAYLREAMQRAPGNTRSYLMLAALNVQRKDFAGAEKILKQATEAAPKSPDPWFDLGRFYVITQRLPEAEAQFRHAAELDPHNAPALLELGRTQNANGKKDEAEKTFRKVAEFPDAQYKFMHAIFAWQQGKSDEAIAELTALAKKDPNDREARTRLVAAYLTSGKTSEAERILSDALKKNQKDTDALLQRSEIYLREGQIAKAQNDVTEVLRAKPDDALAHYRLSKIWEVSGQPLQRRQELNEALRLSPGMLAVRTELADVLIEGKSPTTAVELLDAAPADQKNTVPIVVERNWALWALGDMPAMRKGIDAGLARERSADLLFQDGLWKLKEGKTAEAREPLEEALKLNPLDPRPMSAIAHTYDVQKQTPMVLKKVKEYAASEPKSAAVQDFAGWMMFSHGDREGARAAFMAAKNADPNFAKADISLIQMDLSERKMADAETKLRALLAANRVDPTMARTWLANIELAKGNRAGALEEFRKLAEAESGDPKVLNNVAYLMAEYGKQPGEALKYAEKAVELAPDEPNYYDTLGWVLYQQGVYASAVKNLERATSKPKGNVIWQYHLAMAYAKAEKVRGRKTLEAALTLNPNVPEAKAAREVVGLAK